MSTLLAMDWKRFVGTKRFFVMRTVAVGAPLAVFLFGWFFGRFSFLPTDALGRTIFGTTTVFLLVAILAGGPALAGPALAVERRNGRLDVLLATPVTLRQVVWSRFLGRAGLLAILVVTGVPWLMIALLFGGVSSGEVWRAVAVLGAALLAATGISLLAGAGTDDPTAAVRRAVFATIGPVAAASVVGSLVGGTGATDLLVALGAVARSADPFAALAVAGESAPRAVALVATFCALATLAGVLGAVLSCSWLQSRRDGARRGGGPAVRAGSLFAFWSRRARGRLRLRSAYSRFPALLRQAPLAWLEVVRGTHRPGLGRLLVLVLLGLAAEGLFVAGMIGAEAPYSTGGGGECATGRFTVDSGLGLHLGATSVFLALAFVTVTAAGAAAFHRDHDARLLEVIHSSPRTTREIVAGKLGGALAAAAPWWALALGHAVAGLAFGSFALGSVLCFAFTSAALLLCAGAVALTEGLQAPTGPRAAVRAFLRLALGVILPSILLSPMTMLTMARSPGNLAEVFVAVLWMPMLPLLFEPGSRHVVSMFVASGIMVLIASRLVRHTLARRLPELYAWRREGQTGPPPDAKRGVDEDIRKWRLHVRGTAAFPRIRRSRR